MSSTSTTQSRLLQRKARNDAVQHAVVLLMLVATAALSVQVYWDSVYEQWFFASRAEKIARVHDFWHASGGYVDVLYNGSPVWCGPVLR